MWCFHDRLREFTFKDGTHIKMCPDCTQFDNRRRETLRISNVEVPKAKEQIHFNHILDEAGLNEHVGEYPWLSYTSNLKASLDSPYVGEWRAWPDVVFALKTMLKIKRQRTIPTPLDDQEWVDRQKPFQHSRTMPRKLISYCVACVEVVVDSTQKRVRTTKGVYQPIEHDCGLRVYDLHNNLLEVRAI